MLTDIKGLHHVTSMAAGANANNRFFTRLLGLRRVKKTVNFDRPDVYHLYYGDETGSPGTVMTYFPFPGMAKGNKGAGEVGVTAFSVPPGSLQFWENRLSDNPMGNISTDTRFGEKRLVVSGPDGDEFALVEVEDERVPWTTDEISADVAIRGFHSVSMRLNQGDAMRELLGFMNYDTVDEKDNVLRVAVENGNEANTIDLEIMPSADASQQGAGSVHHVAFAVEDRAAQLRVREALLDTGYAVTPVIDRDYFWAIYFRTPGGILFEVATNEPGFDRDEEIALLGTGLKLPTQHEHLRAMLENDLETIEDLTMSWNPAIDPQSVNAADPDAIETVIIPRSRDLGGFEVRRALPSPKRQMVGPFVFFDQTGPAEFITGQGIDVRPHPHIGLSTLTYLFEGEFQHRDSLGTDQMIFPGEVNWMTAGKGITHSERTSQETRKGKSKLFGIQTWVALPEDKEEADADFEHIGTDEVPRLESDGKDVNLVIGKAWGETNPITTHSEMFYADALLAPGAAIPLPDDHEDRGVYIVEGSIEVAGQSFEPGRMAIFRPGDAITVRAGEQGARLIILGGETLNGPRYLWWNFVASSKEKIEAAKEAWAEGEWENGRFQLPPDDADEFIPLPG